MKNKKAIYILLPLVLIIWGLIIYRIVEGTSQAEEYNAVTGFMEMDQAQQQSDTFSLIADYTDPFLDHLWEYDEDVVVEEVDQAMAQPVIQAPVVMVYWPKLSYGGLVKNQKSNKQVALLTINEWSHLMKVGDKIDGVLLQKVYPDSVVVSYEKEIKTISK